METAKLKRFAQFARRTLRDQVTAKLKLVLADGSAARRENGAAVQALEEQISLHGQDQVIERVAYTWFNRFCALRFMDVNRYNSVGVLSPERGQFQPEILAEAKMGHIDSEMVPERTRQQIAALLEGKSPSSEPQAEAYRLLVVAVCNFWNSAMPFLFARIADYTELLMPDDLLSGISVVTLTREAMPPDVCQDIEVIGWLYQFYISEKKERVFEGLKKGKKIAPENIPAATQLFTPHWIVRYLVENSLGRLWMLNRPQSKLVEKMNYYIKPEQPETDFLRIDSPEEIKICDPACGSGHMLVYAFDLLYTIYEDEGYPATEIPEKILTHNLFGIEIDERAGELAAFALTMKARSRNNRFLRKPVQPNICVLENVHFEDEELKQYMDFAGRGALTDRLRAALHKFEEADNFGSLIRPDSNDIEEILSALSGRDSSEHLFLDKTNQNILRVLRQAQYLAPKYHVVIANPPYMGGKGLNAKLGSWLKALYPDNKSDLFAAFVERIIAMASLGGAVGVMTPLTWMFLSSFEKLRSFLLSENAITTLVRPEYHAFFESAFVPICAFTLFRRALPKYRGSYIDLTAFYGADRQAQKTLEAIRNPNCGWLHRASSEDFRKIPGSPIAYWATEAAISAFEKGVSLDDVIIARIAMATGDNGLFVRSWAEVSFNKIGFDIRSNRESVESGNKWFPCNKGGGFRKWYGNNENIVNWLNDGLQVKALVDPETGRIRSHNYNGDLGFRESVTWSAVSSSKLGARYCRYGFMFVTPGSSAFKKQPDINLYVIQALLSSVCADYFLRLISATMNIEVGNLLKIPFIDPGAEIVHIAESCVNLAKGDWDAYESSWDFAYLELLDAYDDKATFESTYRQLRGRWRERTLKMQCLEQDNNRIFIDAYRLEAVLKPAISLDEVTLNCNPYHLYGSGKTDEELEALLQADSIRDFISYAVGCMFGRYALEKPGLVLANQGDTIERYLDQIPDPSFPADKDNVIPILDGDWFPDDISARFRKFLRVTFGDENFEENLNFIEHSIGKDIRTYFARDFYNDHLKRYKKRPIYWLFSSPKGSFNALIYVHRYRPDTVSVVLNDYLREFRTKLTSRFDHLNRVETSGDTSKAEKTKALKEIENLKKTIDELAGWEREVLYPLASQQIEIDLDDGVKVNYAKFGAALKKIPGLDASEE